MITKDRGPGTSLLPAGSRAVRPRAPAPGGHSAAGRDDAAWIAQRIALEAGAQTARLTLQASAQTAAICETAEREAGQVWHQASAQAAAIREAAEREAAELRAAVTKLAAGLGELIDADGADARPVRKISRPADRPAATPPRRPAAQPAAPGRVTTKGRQVRAMRKVMAAFVVLSLAGLTSGAAEIGLHGFSFFLFRNAGAGAGNPRDLSERQGPGQPGAPTAHRQVVSPSTQGIASPGDRHANRPHRGSDAPHR